MRQCHGQIQIWRRADLEKGRFGERQIWRKANLEKQLPALLRREACQWELHSAGHDPLPSLDETLLNARLGAFRGRSQPKAVGSVLWAGFVPAG